MKTIRNGVFETNSSSTHSITIQNIGNNTIKPLVEDGILYPDRLDQFVLKNNSDNKTTICDTYDKKSAIIANWIHAFYVEENIEKNEFDKYIRVFLDHLIYKDIVFEENYPDYYPWSDNFEFDLSIKNIIKLIDEVINDSSKEIIEYYENY